MPSGAGTSLNGGVPTPAIFSSKNSSTHVLLALIVQFGGVAVATILAGLSDDVADLMIFLMIGILLLFMIMNASKFQGITNILTNAEQGA